MKVMGYFIRVMQWLLVKQKFHNFHITNPNGMNQSFTCRQKYNLWGKKFNFLWFFGAAIRTAF